MTKPTFIVVDDFLRDPLKERDHAMTLEFGVTGNFPGRRAPATCHPAVRAAIQSLMPSPILHWGNEAGASPAGANGHFQSSVASDETWVHCDNLTLRVDGVELPADHWGGVLYLTPDPPPGSGTHFFENRRTGERNGRGIDEDRRPELSDFHKVDEVANRFNRLAIFDSDMYHSAGPSFGTNIATGRLFRVFFFATAPTLAP